MHEDLPQPTRRHIELRLGKDRGTFTNPWLHARFSFSFGSSQPPGQAGHGLWRALSGNIVPPGTGFDMHGTATAQRTRRP